MDPASPLLFFDSGVGGLSVLGPARMLLPSAPIVYAADSAWFPYGKRTEAEIAERVPALLARLVERFRPRLAVIACNTASTIALDHARAALDLPIVGTVPAIKPAAEMSTTRVIGVLGTEATVRQPYVDDLAARFASDCTIIRHGSPELVELAGGRNLFGETGKHSPWLDWEALHKSDPEIIVILPCGFDLRRTRQEAQALIRRPGWAKLRAVRSQQVFLADGNHYFNRPGPRLVESLEILAEIIHPKVFHFGHEGKGWEKL